MVGNEYEPMSRAPNAGFVPIHYESGDDGGHEPLGFYDALV